MQTEGETGRRGRGRGGGHPVHALHARHDVDRGGEGGEPDGPQLVPALRHARPGDLLRPDPPGGRRRLRHAVLHRRHPVAGARLRDKRNGFSIPPQLTLGTILNAIPRPWWWWDFLTTPKLEFASLSATGGTVGELLDAAMDPSISLRGPRGHPRAVARQDRHQGRAERRGLQEARRPRRRRHRAVQPRRPPARPRADPLPPAARTSCARSAAARRDARSTPGIMNGADIVAVDRLGAKFTLIGRAYLYGLMAGGRAGVDRDHRDPPAGGQRGRAEPRARHPAAPPRPREAASRRGVRRAGAREFRPSRRVRRRRVWEAGG
jgi:L-lactate dehydrogenase (cytochrome)